MQGCIFTLLILNFSLFSHLSARTFQSLPDTAYRIPRTQPEEGAPIDRDISFVDEEYLEQEYLTDYSNSAQTILRHESQNSKQGKNTEKFDSKLELNSKTDLKTEEFFDNSLLKHLNQNSSLPQMNVSKNSSSFNHTEPEGEIKRLPQAIIIGVKKSGTRALLQFLRTHPNIRSPGPEIHFFDKHYDNGLEWYRSQMPSTLPGQITVEKTPSYWITKPAPQRVYSMSPQTSLIVVVRDPTTRALSDYTQASSKRPDIGTFEKMAFVDNYTVDTSWGAIRIGLYALHFSNWISYFPRERIHFVSGERLVTHPAEELAKVQDFLGLERLITDKHFYFNTTKGFPCLVKSEGSASPRCLGKTKGRPHPVVDPSVLSRLRKFYYPFNEKFYRMTGIDFGWPVS